MSPTLTRGGRYAKPAAAAAGFNAADWGTVLAEFDFSDTSKITESSGLVSDVAPKSGSYTDHIVQATGANKPITGTRTQNSLNVLDFDTSDSLFADVANKALPITVACVAQSDLSTAGDRRVVGYGAGNATLYQINTTWQLYSGSSVNSFIPGSTAAAVVATFSGSGKTLIVNGRSISTSTAATEPIVSFSIGEAWDGWIGHLLWFDGVIADPAGLCDALMDKWGITPQFNAADYGTVLAEFDFSNTASITSSGGAVSQVDAVQGSKPTAIVQATGANQPITGTRTQNSLNVIDFDGSDDYLEGDPADEAQPVTVAIVFQSDNPDSNLRKPFTSGDFGLWAHTDNVWYQYAGSFHYTGVSEDTSPHVFVAIFDGASSDCMIDGVSHTGNPGTQSMLKYTVGSSNAGGGHFWDGWIGHVIYYDGVVADPAGLTAALQTKWWSPTFLPGLVAWYDASNAGSITSSGSPARVSQWNDLSGNGHHLTQATGGNQPSTGVNTIGSKNALTFTRSRTDYMTASTGTLTQPSTILMVVQRTAVSGGTNAIPVDANHGTNRHQTWDAAGTWNMYAGSIANTTRAVSTSTAHNIISVYNTTASTFWDDGTQYGGSLSVGTSTMQDLMVGASAAAYGWDGYLAEFVLMNAAASAGDIASWTAYCQAKWGTA